MFQVARTLLILLVCSTFLIGQTVPEKNATEDAEKLRKEAVMFLRETLGDVNSMRSLENRISFTAEVGGLMWFHDEREARAIYSGAIGDFRDLILRYDALINSLGVTPEDSENSMGFMGFMSEPTDKAKALRKLRTAIAVGQQISMSLAEHDPELAYSFYYESLSAITNPEFRKQTESGAQFFESQLLSQIAETNAAKAAQLGSRSLNKGLTSSHIELLKKIHAKDADKGVEFGSAILGRVKSEKFDPSDFYMLSSLLEFGGQTLEASRKPGGKKAVYTTAELREIAEVFAQAILSRSDDGGGMSIAFVDVINKYAPGRAAQIRAKFKTRMSSANTNAKVDFGDDGPPPGVVYASNSNANSNSMAAYERQAREREERDKAEKKLMEDVQNLGTKPLPKEEREKIIAQMRKIIMQGQSREKKVMALSALAAQVAKVGDKELASEIMRDAERLVNPAPRNYRDFLLSWMLASGYAASDPDKAFPLLEDTIARANGTLEAFVKVGEFIDVAEEMVADGEVQVGAFGGQMVRGLTRELGMADATIQVLAKADFGKTKNLANRFDRTEIRVLAKMMILRAVLDVREKPKAEEGLPVLEPDDPENE